MFCVEHPIERVELWWRCTVRKLTQTPQRSAQERRQKPIEHGHTRLYSPTSRRPPPGEVTFVLLSPSVPPATSRFPPPAGQRFHCTAVVPMGKINSSDDFFTFLAHTDAGPPCWLPLATSFSVVAQEIS